MADREKFSDDPDARTELLLDQSGSPRVAAPEATAFAQGALRMTANFHSSFHAQRYGTPPLQVLLMDPDALSTDGGKKARQTILLVALGDDRQRLMLGWIDSSERSMALRSLEQLRGQHQARFQRPLGLDPAAGEALLNALASFGSANGLRLLPPERAGSRASVVALPPSRPARPIGLWLGLVALLLLALAIGIVLGRASA